MRVTNLIGAVHVNETRERNQGSNTKPRKSSMMQRSMYIVCALVLVSATISFAGLAPERMNYQATLEDGNGDPVTTQITVTFRIYNTAVAKAVLWEEARIFTPDTNGMFSILLGEVTPLNQAAFATSESWLGITVGGDSELAPRTRLVSSPYSFRVNTIDQAEGGTIKGPLVMEESNQRGLAPSILMAGTAGDTVQICVSGCALFRATNAGGAELINLSISGIDNSASFVITGPGGDDQAIFSSQGAELFTNDGRALAERVRLRPSEGLILSNTFDAAPGSDDQAVFTSSGAELFANDGRALSKTIALSPNEGLVVLSNTNEADTVIHIFQEAGRGLPMIRISDPSGGTVEFGTANNAMTVYDAAGEPQVAVGFDAIDGGVVSLLQNAASGFRAATERVRLTNEGLFFFGADATADKVPLDTLLHIDINGSITAKGQPNIGNNTATGDSTTVSGGYDNIADEYIATVSGGANNNASRDGATIGGGDFNYCNGVRATIAGGSENDCGGGYGSISGGQDNFNHGPWGALSGGQLNSISAVHGMIGGGYQNYSQDSLAAVLGGAGNQCKGVGGTIGAGLGNSVMWSADSSVVSGGSRNTTYAVSSSILGGHWNRIDSQGTYATIAGGWSNTANGEAAAVTGGKNNKAIGDYSMASGRNARAMHDGSMVFSAAINAIGSDTTASGGVDQIVMRADSGMYITDHAGEALYDPAKLINTSSGAYLSSGGVWTDAPKARGEITPVDGSKVLGLLEELPVNEWCDADEASVRHVGPLPENFHAVTGLGNNDGSISSADMAGVALAAVKELHKMVQQQQQLALELRAKDQQIESLEMRLTQMEAMMEIILAQRDGASDGTKTLASNR